MSTLIIDFHGDGERKKYKSGAMTLGNREVPIIGKLLLFKGDHCLRFHGKYIYIYICFLHVPFTLNSLLSLKVLSKMVADDILIFYQYFSEKIRLHHENIPI